MTQNKINSPEAGIISNKNQRLIERFQMLYREKFDEDISLDVARLHLDQLAELVRLTAPRKENAKNA